MYNRIAISFLWLLPLKLLAQQDLPADSIRDALFTSLNKATSDTARIAAHIRIAEALTISDYRKALEHATLAVQLSEQNGDPALRYVAYNKAGGLYAHKGLYDLAFNFYNKHYELAQQNADAIESGTANFNLSGLYLMLGKYAKARNELMESESLLRKAYQAKGQQIPQLTFLTFRMNLALCEMYLGNFRRSDSLLDLSLPMVQGQPDMEPKLQSLYHIRALMYLNSNRPESALKQLASARTLAIRRHDLPAMASICLTAGESYQEIGDTAAARQEFHEGFSYAQELNGLSVMVALSEKLYQIYRKTGPPDSMVRYLDLSTDLKGQSKAEEAKEALMRKDLMRAYDSMVEDWEKRQRTQRMRTLILIIVILLFAAAFIIGFFYYRGRYHRMRLERVQRDLEARRIEMELLRHQAELGRRDEELEQIRRQLDKQQLVEGLVGGLQALHGRPAETGSGNKESAGIPPSQRRIKAWEEFEFRLQQIHNGFYDRLNQRFPNLTINERRICALLQLDLTTKEISDITGQTVRAVNLARIRLRKKLGISHTDKELFDFLANL